MELREHRRDAPDDADGPTHPHPGVGGVSTPRRPNATPGGGFKEDGEES
ncbi:MAG: hypothetical protein ACOX9B_10105 [Candidatus Xenobium sp.]|nr:hypothetical protein [Burkholderiales bacterium]